ncbi:hypothetical protein XENTR_v10002833 [Xenopus tropicalis]|nr:hypothetical protein XENTR_v10002833 [Xenopus tropicalis]
MLVPMYDGGMRSINAPAARIPMPIREPGSLRINIPLGEISTRSPAWERLTIWSLGNCPVRSRVWIWFGISSHMEWFSTCVAILTLRYC